MNGVFLVDKPVGVTSTGALRRLQKQLSIRKIGHAGTLDPGASGLLVVCVGRATRLASWLVAGEKDYSAVVRFGSETDTDDHEGTPIREAFWSHVNRDVLTRALGAFQGEIMQTPPRISALKRGGERMYDRVRRGEQVDDLLEPRPVRLDRLDLVGWKAPLATFEMTVGKGFYVRSLARDLGRHLDSAAHLSSLRRTRVGSFDVANARPLDEVEPSDLITLAGAVSHLPTLRVAGAAAQWLRHGRPVREGPEARLEGDAEPGADVRAVDDDGALLAVVARNPDGAFVVRKGFTGTQESRPHSR